MTDILGKATNLPSNTTIYMYCNVTGTTIQNRAWLYKIPLGNGEAWVINDRSHCDRFESWIFADTYRELFNLIGILPFNITGGTYPFFINSTYIAAAKYKLNGTIKINNYTALLYTPYKANQTHIFLNDNYPALTGKIVKLTTTDLQVREVSWNATITSLSYSQQRLTAIVDGPSGTNSTIKIYCGDLGSPYSVTSNSTITDWSYDSATKILTVTVQHSSPVQIVVDWNFPAVGSGEEEEHVGGGTVSPPSGEESGVPSIVKPWEFVLLIVVVLFVVTVPLTVSTAVKFVKKGLRSPRTRIRRRRKRRGR